jgi:hypothetical protein
MHVSRQTTHVHVMQLAAGWYCLQTAVVCFCLSSARSRSSSQKYDLIILTPVSMTQPHALRWRVRVVDQGRQNIFSAKGNAKLIVAIISF